MADVTVQVLEPATSFALLTLDEAKTMLGIAAGDTAQDVQLQFQIDTNSAVIAAKCGNRVFARETVREYWRELQPNRLFLTHWPVQIDDIESVESPEGTVLSKDQYQLEECSGKVLLLPGGAMPPAQPVVVQYTGGYYLPDQAPAALKQAVGLLVGLTKAEQAAVALTGIRMISHKSARVMFHSNPSGQQGGGGSAVSTRAAVDSLLSHFTRHWV